MTPASVYRQIVLTAVPASLSLEETDALVTELVRLAATMPHDEPASVFHAYRCQHFGTARFMDTPECVAWRRHTFTLVREAERQAVLARIRSEYPSIHETGRVGA